MQRESGRAHASCLVVTPLPWHVLRTKFPSEPGVVTFKELETGVSQRNATAPSVLSERLPIFLHSRPSG